MKNFSIALVAATLLLAGCADDSAPATTQATTTTVPATTATPSTTTGAPETSPTTEAPTTTTSTTGAPQARGPFVAVTDVDLVQIDPSDGSVSNVLFEFFNGEGTFRGVLNLTDNDTVVYQELWEDYWFSCEASRGVIGAIALVDGEPEAIAEGLAPSLSPDGTHLAYLDASDCIPDPEAADSWVLTPLDTVVVTDLVDGTSVTISSSETPQSPSDPAALQWVGWHPDGDLLVADNDGSVYRVRWTAPSRSRPMTPSRSPPAPP